MCRAIRNSVFVQVALLAAFIPLFYSAGLPGGFLLDDFANLKTLERIKEPLDLAKVGGFVFSNDSGDSGRLLPLLSFAAQYAAWPGDPAAFKSVNIALHTLNSLLVFWLTRQFAEIRWASRGAVMNWVAFLVSGTWALHPLLVSTVLYTVQRMAIMSAMFMFLGFAVYLIGRRQMDSGNRSGVLLMTAGVIGGTLLATACKENGALLPLVVLTAEFTLLDRLRRGRAWSVWLGGTLILPLGILLGYIAYRFGTWILPGYAIRDYTLVERLLTEARVLANYLAQIVFPQPAGLGLFHDDYVVSRSLGDPLSTSPAVALITGLCLGAILLRKRAPALSMGILWYFGAHILESGPIPLELYFEHRNYFPLAGLLIGVGVGVAYAAKTVGVLAGYSRYVVLAAFGWLVMLGVVAYGEILLWADPYAQAGAWAMERPDSIRAQAHWAKVLAQMGFVERSEEIHESLSAKDPGFLLIAVSSNCLRGETRFMENYSEAQRRMRTARFSRTVISALERLVTATEAGRCLDTAGIVFDQTVAGLLDNPNFASRRYHLLVLRGRYRIVNQRHPDARSDFMAALALRPNVEIALLVVKASYLAGDQAQARTELNLARQINARNRISRWTYAQDIQEWAAAVESMQSAPAGTGDTDERSGGTAPVSGPGNANEDGRRRVRTADHRDHPGT